MNLPSLPAQHLSDEALAAFADGALGNGARGRAARHIAQCRECAHAVAVQREAVWALRAAPAPALPCGLLDRLRAVPSTTPLNQQPVELDDAGSAVFPAFGTAAVVEPSAPPPRDAGKASTSSEHRLRPYGLLTAAAAVVAIGAVSGTVIGAGDSGPGTPRTPGPAAPAHVRPAVGPSVDLYLQPVAGTAEFARATR